MVTSGPSTLVNGGLLQSYVGQPASLVGRFESVCAMMAE